MKCLHTQYGYWLAVQERQKARNSSAQNERSEGSEVAVDSSPQDGIGAAAAAEANTSRNNHANGDSTDINARDNKSASTAEAVEVDPFSCLDGITHPVGDWIHALLLEQQANETAAEKPKASAARRVDEP